MLFLLPNEQWQRTEGDNSLTKCELITDDENTIELMYVLFMICQTV